MGMFGLLFCSLFLLREDIPSYVAYGQMGEIENVVTVLFTGDIMLAREVGRIMERADMEYPFKGIKDMVLRADVAVGNFEASVPEIYEETPDFGFRFSAREETLSMLRDVGFDYLSLANNHSLDFGVEGHTHTQQMCQEFGIVCEGAPGAITRSVVSAEGVKVGILSVDVTRSEAQDMFHEVSLLAEESDIQIAYIHWGEEYAFVHNDMQENLAHQFIDAGIDAVIGHHPHVVQDVAVYKGKPIFYSLGNLVFDQYFDTDVQEGLMVQLSIRRDILQYTLIPVSSVQTPSQPHVMGLDERDAFLEKIGTRPVLTFRHGLAEQTIISTMEGHK